jgi:hypothetical protein
MSRSLCLLNIPISDEDLGTKDGYEALCDEMREEFSKYGKIALLSIPRGGAHRGTVFVQYATQPEAAHASGQLQGRSFAGKLVRCTFISDEAVPPS